MIVNDMYHCMYVYVCMLTRAYECVHVYVRMYMCMCICIL